MANFIYENFRVAKKSALNSEDVRVLTQMYLPLIGPDSYCVYSVLISLEPNETYTFKRILDILNFKNIKIVDKAIDKLEGIGLVKTYYNEAKGYVYELLSPLSEKEFLANELLASLLETQIGPVEFQKIASTQKTRVSGYKNITKKFSDVFSTSTRSVQSTMAKLFEKSIELENPDFNYTLFKVLFDNSVLSEDVLNDAEFKSRIERISFTYRLNEDEMKDIIIKTMDVDHCLEYASISKNARLAFQKKHKSSGPRIETNSQDAFLPSAMDDEYQALLNVVENQSIAETLESISHIKPSVSEIKMFEDLQNSTHFPTSVINVMILYVSNEKNGELPGYNYFEKIANSWARAKVKTAYDALKLLTSKKEEKEKKQTSPQTSKNVKAVPAWYDEYTKSLGKKEDEPMTKEEQEYLENLVKDIFG